MVANFHYGSYSEESWPLFVALWLKLRGELAIVCKQLVHLLQMISIATVT
jgi:hypothetical protein